MRTSFVLSTLLASALLAGCDSPSAINNYSLIDAEARRGTLTVSNVGALAVHYNVLERNDAAAITWVRCTPADAECPTLQPRETVSMPYSQIGAYDDGDTEAILYWWETEPDGAGGYRIGRKGSKIVRL